MSGVAGRPLPDLYATLSDVAPGMPLETPHRGTYVTKADIETVDEGRATMLLGSVGL